MFSYRTFCRISCSESQIVLEQNKSRTRKLLRRRAPRDYGSTDKKCAKAEAKRMLDEYNKKELSKASGNTKNQELKPIKDGTKQNSNSAQTK